MKYKFIDAEAKIKNLQERQGQLESKHREIQVELDLLNMIPEDERDENTEIMISQRNKAQQQLDTGWDQLQILIDDINKEEALKAKNGRAPKKTVDEPTVEADLVHLNGDRKARRASKSSTTN